MNGFVIIYVEWRGCGVGLRGVAYDVIVSKLIAYSVATAAAALDFLYACSVYAIVNNNRAV